MKSVLGSNRSKIVSKSSKIWLRDDKNVFLAKERYNQKVFYQL